MYKIENVPVLFIENTDFADSQHCCGMSHLQDSVRAEMDTAELVIYKDLIIKNRHGDTYLSGGEMIATKNLLLPEVAVESKSKMLCSLLEIIRQALPEAEECDMDKCLLLAAELAGDIDISHRQSGKALSFEKWGGSNA